MKGLCSMNDKERIQAGKHQFKYFLSTQYPMWRVTLVKTIRKILEDPIGFYEPLYDEIQRYEDEDMPATIKCEVRNGLFFEALSQSIQAIEDLFSLMRKCDDLAYFAKNVITYQASEVTKYIQRFDTNDTEYLLKQYGLPYFDLDAAWENEDVFHSYVEAVNLIKQYMDTLIAHHQKFYLHYCQYKHGLAVALRPFETGVPTGGGDPFEGSVMTFDNKNYSKRNKGKFGQFMIPDFHPSIAPHLSALHDEDNLLRAEQRVVNIQDFVDVTEKAYTLLSVLHRNMDYFCDIDEAEPVHEYAFPTKDYKKLLIIGFPIDEFSK